jgi:hypothetical protein
MRAAGRGGVRALRRLAAGLHSCYLLCRHTPALRHVYAECCKLSLRSPILTLATPLLPPPPPDPQATSPAPI